MIRNTSRTTLTKHRYLKRHIGIVAEPLLYKVPVPPYRTPNMHSTGGFDKEQTMADIVKFNKSSEGREALERAEEMLKNLGAYSRMERWKIMQDMRYETEAKLQGWTEEEKLNNRAEFDRESDETRKMLGNEFKLIYDNGEGLTEFEKKKTERYMEEHPEDKDIITGLTNMIVAGINDPEHITEYAD